MHVIRRIFLREEDIRWSGFRYVREQPSDIGAARRELGWTPQYDLAATMKDCAAFIRGQRSREQA